ncbi:MAG: STAS domain-containing protein [Desulfovibrionaceae bacterium]
MFREERMGKAVALTLTQDTIVGNDADLLHDAVERHMRHDSGRIVLDLSQVISIDSRGLDAIVRLNRTPRGRRRLVLCGVGGALGLLLRVTRLDRVFTIRSSRDAALR